MKSYKMNILVVQSIIKRKVKYLTAITFCLLEINLKINIMINSTRLSFLHLPIFIKNINMNKTKLIPSQQITNKESCLIPNHLNNNLTD